MSSGDKKSSNRTRLLMLSLGLGAVPGFLSATGVKRLAFIPTGGDVYEDPYFVLSDRRELARLGYELIDVRLGAMEAAAAHKLLSTVDAIYVAGGNTFYLMQELQESGLVGPLVSLVQEGMPYIGASAGAVILGPSVEPVKDLDDPTQAPKLRSFEGLGIVDFVVLPHFGKKKYLAQYEAIVDRYRSSFELVLLRDEEAVVVEDGNRVVVRSELTASEA